MGKIIYNLKIQNENQKLHCKIQIKCSIKRHKIDKFKIVIPRLCSGQALRFSRRLRDPVFGRDLRLKFIK